MIIDRQEVVTRLMLYSMRFLLILYFNLNNKLNHVVILKYFTELVNFEFNIQVRH